MNKYTKFGLMILTSTLVMFGLMYLNTYEVDHVFFSETRTYMSIYMGAMMAIVMMLFMLNMYQNTKANIAVLMSAIIIFAGSLYLVRSQDTVADEAWMSAMIPHHSIAILTSERANIDDIRVRELADEIIKAQRREIKEMNWLLEDIAQNGEVKSESDLNNRQVPNFEGEL